MMEYEEFKNLKQEADKNNPFCPIFVYDDGSKFYLEPVFYTQLHGFKEQYKDRYQEIIDEIEVVVRKNKNVVLTGNFEYPLTAVEGFIYLEITDITDRLKIFAEDKSRGSDYGD